MAKVKVRHDDIVGALNDIPEGVMTRAGKYFRKITPKDKGYAKRNTTYSDSGIKANYAYAHRLDTGWSKQAPNGMSDPTIEYIEQQIDRNVRKF
jgi:hypothetical protein